MMKRWFEALAGLALVAAWLMVAWTSDADLRGEDLAAQAKAEQTRSVVAGQEASARRIPGARS